MDSGALQVPINH